MAGESRCQFHDLPIQMVKERLLPNQDLKDIKHFIENIESPARYFVFINKNI